MDASVYIGHWERGLYEDTLAEIRKTFVIRYSAVQLSELRRERERVRRSGPSTGCIIWRGASGNPRR
ncbi:MAG TPA: hypothetical protein VN461_11345 [Vicinamibacteria bacterium]|jgi:hypothetical protein|nr:hypothetical protein [Vicinamibacteria bacterium]